MIVPSKSIIPSGQGHLQSPTSLISDDFDRESPIVQLHKTCALLQNNVQVRTLDHAVGLRP